jgi:hypothetical protein
MDKELQILSDFIKILLPAGIVSYALYLTVKSFLTKDFEKRLIEIKLKNTEVILPIRLQAYERMCLFLERISPHNLVVRVNDPSYSVGLLHQILLKEIRDEYAHNMSQQVYMSDQAWRHIKNTMDEIINLINNSSHGLPKDARGIELAKSILDRLVQLPEDPSSKALTFVKNEIRQFF